MHNPLYRAVWRWHFYAGLAVLPFLAWLAVTGGLYLYKPEIEGLVYRAWTHVPAGAALPIATLTASVERQAQAKVLQIAFPATRGTSWRMTLATPEGTRRLAFVDPQTGALLGTTGDGGVMQIVRTLHSLAIAGPIGNALIECVAGWAILLVASGLYLWWPRRGAPVFALRGRPAGRLFWRDLHASVGLVAAAVILFLALTGMPWTGVWGGALQRQVAGHGLGRPAPPAADPHAGHDSLPWSLQAAGQPMAEMVGDLGPDRIARIAAARGLAPPWTMTLPSGHAPYLVSAAIIRADDAHILYLDPATGAVLQDSRYAGFGAGARTIEWGIAVHQGQHYGEPNRLVMLAGCVAILLLALTAPVLWWKRRRHGRLRAPPAADPRSARGVAALMLAVGALFPLTGASLLAVLLAERAFRRIAR
jgi:uncharacterized iron-regulated membrane protein